MYTKEYVAARIDHAVLKPFATRADVLDAALMCTERGVCSLCVRPTDVSIATQALADSQTFVSMVVGFPHGANQTSVKCLEARQGLEQGARELDMVMNIGRFLSGDHGYVGDDIAALVEEAHAADALLKVILETCYLDSEQIAHACVLCLQAGADFVKTSTGFGSRGATPDAVAVMLATVGESAQVKASGGISDWATAVAYLDQGCTRLGVGSTEKVLDGGRAEGDY